MIRKHKKFNRPKKAFDSERIKEENVILEKYGLKNKREIWKAKAKLDNMRRHAKSLIDEGGDKQEVFLSKLRKEGYNIEKTVDVLALTVDDVLKRRLQSLVLNKGIATQPKQARQLITHKHILINDKVVNIPSYHVDVDEENLIKLKVKKKVRKVAETTPEASLDTEEVKVEENSEEPKVNSDAEKTETSTEESKEVKE